MTLKILKNRWNNNTINKAMLELYVKKGIISTEQFIEITKTNIKNCKND